LGAIEWREVFGEQADIGPHPTLGYHNPDHPPLGRLAIGMGHDIARAIDRPVENQSPFSAVSARVAPALAFAVLVALVGFMTARWYGPPSGVIAAIALVLMPRVFGHAHLAALETFIGLAYTGAVLAVADR
jgi:hypothetical protein